MSDRNVFWESASQRVCRQQSHCGRKQAASLSCREAALLRREERKRKREREDKAAAEDSKADRAAAEKAAAGKEKGEGAVDMEQAGQVPEKQAGEVKEETDVAKVKEEGSSEDAPMAADPLSSTIHNGNDVSASRLCDSP